VVKSVLRLFDELVKCDEEGALKDVRKAAEVRVPGRGYNPQKSLMEEEYVNR